VYASVSQLCLTGLRPVCRVGAWVGLLVPSLTLWLSGCACLHLWLLHVVNSTSCGHLWCSASATVECALLHQGKNHLVLCWYMTVGGLSTAVTGSWMCQL